MSDGFSWQSLDSEHILRVLHPEAVLRWIALGVDLEKKKISPDSTSHYVYLLRNIMTWPRFGDSVCGGIESLGQGVGGLLLLEDIDVAGLRTDSSPDGQFCLHSPRSSQDLAPEPPSAPWLWPPGCRQESP